MERTKDHTIQIGNCRTYEEFRSLVDPFLDAFHRAVAIKHGNDVFHVAGVVIDGFAAEITLAPVKQEKEDTGMDAQHFRRMFEVLHNMDMDTLVTAGLIEPGDYKNWIRFNNDLTTFVLKLDAERVEKLVALVFERQVR